MRLSRFLEYECVWRQLADYLWDDELEAAGVYLHAKNVRNWRPIFNPGLTPPNARLTHVDLRYVTPAVANTILERLPATIVTLRLPPALTHIGRQGVAALNDMAWLEYFYVGYQAFHYNSAIRLQEKIKKIEAIYYMDLL